MKVSFFAIAALWVGVALAQAPERVDHLATLLDLTAEQKTQVQAVLDAEHAKMKAAHDQAASSGTKPSHSCPRM